MQIQKQLQIHFDTIELPGFSAPLLSAACTNHTIVDIFFYRRRENVLVGANENVLWTQQNVTKSNVFAYVHCARTKIQNTFNRTQLLHTFSSILKSLNLNGFN